MAQTSHIFDYLARQLVVYGNDCDDSEDGLLDKFKNHKEELAKEDNDGMTFLHHLVESAWLAKRCPRKVLEFILDVEPSFIQKPTRHDDEAIPLARVMRPDLADMTQIIVGFMADRGLELVRPKCLQAAFDTRPTLPVTLLIDLVRLATREMLEGWTRTSGYPTPLQSAVNFSRCRQDPENHLKLVELLLEKYETSVLEYVPQGTLFKFGKRAESAPARLSIYQWHHFGKEKIEVYDERKPELDNAIAGGHLRSGTGTGRPEAVSSYRRSGQEKDGLGKDGNVSGKGGLPTGQLQRRDSAGVRAGGKLSEKPGNAAPVHITIPRPENGVVPDAKSAIKNDYKPEAFKGSDEIQRRHWKVAEAASESIKEMLALSYLRQTVGKDADESEAKMFFQIPGKETEAYHFTLTMNANRNGTPVVLKQEWITNVLQKTKRYRVLRHVALSPTTVSLQKPASRDGTKYAYTDELFFFQWLQCNMGVRKILRVVVDDKAHPHKDEVIENVLSGQGKSGPAKLHSFDVEVLDWRKLDLCPEVVRKSAPNVRELHLQWSGSNSVLRGWSEAEGLPQIKSLKVIYLWCNQVNESSHRIKHNIETFQNRLDRARPSGYGRIIVHPKGKIDDSPNKEGADGASTGSRDHPWLKYVEDVVSKIPALPSAMDTHPDFGCVKVALIDDGVEILSPEMERFQERFSTKGASFDTSVDGPAPYFSSLSGHGTFMARLILHVCPHATIIPYRLMMRPDRSGFFPEPQPTSAAKAIREAMEQDVDIISMSWTIKQPSKDKDQTKYNELREVVNNMKVERAKARKPFRVPLMFCAASDDSIYGSPVQLPSKGPEMPADIADARTFRIGAATTDGQTWPQVSNPANLHFVFPGVDIPKFVELRDRLDQTATLEGAPRDSFAVGAGRRTASDTVKAGSSIATALAAGFAALLIHCVKLGAYYTERMTDANSRAPLGGNNKIENVSLSRIAEIRTATTMGSALESMSKNNAGGAKTVVMDSFADTARQLENKTAIFGPLDAYTHPEHLAPIATLARNLFVK